MRIDLAMLLDWSPPLASVRVACGRGTYIRSLAEDLGETLGVGGSIESLRRTRVGRYGEEQSITLPELERLLASGGLGERLVGLEDALSHLPELVVSEEERHRLLAGRPSRAGSILAFAPGILPGAVVRVLDPGGRLLAIARALVGSDAIASAGSAPPFRLERVIAERVDPA